MEKMIPKEVFKIMACPVCKAALKYNKDKSRLVCTKCNAIYLIEGGVPVLLPPGMQISKAKVI